MSSVAWRVRFRRVLRCKVAGSRLLFLHAVGEVAGISQSGYYITVLVDGVIYGAQPYGGAVVGEVLLDILHCLYRCNDRGHVYLGRHTLGDQGAVAQVHRGTRGQHWIANYKGLAFEARRGKVLNAYIEILLFLVLAIRRYKGVLGSVKLRKPW